MASLDQTEQPTDADCYGESARAILAAASKSRLLRRTPSGGGTFDLTLTPDETGPFFRALMRAEAELLMDDADAFEPLGPLRTPDQRRADAFLEIVTSASASLQR